jgi:hypothetical protein
MDLEEQLRQATASRTPTTYEQSETVAMRAFGCPSAL